MQVFEAASSAKKGRVTKPRRSTVQQTAMACKDTSTEVWSSGDWCV